MLTAYLAMGANLPSAVGSPAATLAAAISRLATLGSIVGSSSLYSTEPVGFADQPRFFNAVIALETSLSPRSLLAALLEIEHEFDRDRSAGLPNGPRTLDLDILMMGDLHLGGSDLDIPHPRLADRAFVLVPLHEIAPHAIVPGRGDRVDRLLQRLLPETEVETLSVVAVHDDRWDAACSSASAGDASRSGSSKPHRHG
jgi:2-amino-4-hydroxy-6-hydroxymethyldihydropteridine diphosphokinase